MRLTLLKQFLLLALAACAPLALADPPALVGRISGVDGQVLVRSGADSNPATLNWPVTSDNVITTPRGAGAEFRVGSSAVRLAGDSELEVVELDDDSFQLRLHYGSVGVRLANPDMLPGFALETEQVRVLMREPGQLRVEAGREAGATVVGVVAGVAELESGAGNVVLRAGKRADVRADDLRTGQWQRDAFDDWPAVAAAPAALRYLGDDVTGYEELDRYGSWRDDAEYGPLWQPSALPAGWAPYRDGRWSWVAPWGWTWIDNAPWGYAPSHYGRWVQLRQRWHWAPGRGKARQVWAPALVHWSGGNHHHTRPTGPGAHRPGGAWQPLAPHQRYVPAYRSAAEQERRLNHRHEHRWHGAADRPADAWRHRDGDRSDAWREQRGRRGGPDTWRGHNRHPGGVIVMPGATPVMVAPGPVEDGAVIVPPGRMRNRPLTTAPPGAVAAPAAPAQFRPGLGTRPSLPGRNPPLRTETEPAVPTPGGAVLTTPPAPVQHPGRDRWQREREHGDDRRGGWPETARQRPQTQPQQQTLPPPPTLPQMPPLPRPSPLPMMRVPPSAPVTAPRPAHDPAHAQQNREAARERMNDRRSGIKP